MAKSLVTLAKTDSLEFPVEELNPNNFIGSYVDETGQKVDSYIDPCPVEIEEGYRQMLKNLNPEEKKKYNIKK